MKNVKLLDCTLRDGGRIINCAFPDDEIRDITEKLGNAKIDIIEVGFLRDWHSVHYEGNSTFFTDVEQITPILNKKNKNVMYLAFIDYGMFDFNSLRPCDGASIDGIRLGFTKKNYTEHRDELIECMKKIKSYGYLLFMQGVNSLNYSDMEMLELVEIVNEIRPYAFGIVDTYGAMYLEDVTRIFNLVDNNMREEISLDFHSHNNYQLSFSFAQEVIRLSSGRRNVIIDATLDGMGKVAGNLNLELVANYLVKKYNYSYDMETLLDIIDDYIYQYSASYSWGYSVPAMLAGIYKSHPNNVIYLMNKFRLRAKDIGHVLSMIEPMERQRYNYDNIERLYVKYIAEKIDDYGVLKQLKDKLGEREVLVLVPGKSIKTNKEIILRYIHESDPFIISVNFLSSYGLEAYAFYGNQKRYTMIPAGANYEKIIVSSNIKAENGGIQVNYYSLIYKGYKYFENSTMMLLKLLKRLGVSSIVIAGFDGFQKDNDNYEDSYRKDKRMENEFEIINDEIGKMFGDFCKQIRESCAIKMITPSIFEKAIKNKVIL